MLLLSSGTFVRSNLKSGHRPLNHLYLSPSPLLSFPCAAALILKAVDSLYTVNYSPGGKALARCLLRGGVVRYCGTNCIARPKPPWRAHTHLHRHTLKHTSTHNHTHSINAKCAIKHVCYRFHLSFCFSLTHSHQEKSRHLLSARI